MLSFFLSYALLRFKLQAIGDIYFENKLTLKTLKCMIGLREGEDGESSEKPKPNTFFVRSFPADRTKTRERSSYNIGSLLAVKASLQSTSLHCSSLAQGMRCMFEEKNPNQTILN